MLPSGSEVATMCSHLPVSQKPPGLDTLSEEPLRILHHTWFLVPRLARRIFSNLGPIPNVKDTAPVLVGVIPNPEGNCEIPTPLERWRLHPMSIDIIGAQVPGVQIDCIPKFTGYKGSVVLDTTVPAFPTGISGHGSGGLVELIVDLEFGAFGVRADGGTMITASFRPICTGRIGRGYPGKVTLGA